ncbi:MAG: M23 family metallopeptidase [Myxococcales bacterium]|nr:M23 family metallopeptidase [Myxococcales bacterium]
MPVKKIMSGPWLWLAITFLLWPLFAAGVATAGEAGTYLWPLKGVAKKITSVLGDPRFDHPHAGIDLSLFGRIGMAPAVAIDDGVLIRLRDSKYGYGKAVYLRLPDGKVAVYAHLDRFSPRLQNLARELRRQTGLERLDYYYDEWEPAVAVRRGEVIGFGGNSGTKTPHLHFELRENEFISLNPLRNGFPVPDDLAPDIHAIQFTPTAPGATVNGQPAPLLIDWPADETAPAPIFVQGPVGIAVAASDRFAAKGDAVYPYRLELRVDGQAFFELRFDRWSWFDRPLQAVMYDRDPADKRSLLRLYNPYPVELPFFTGKNDSLLDRLPAGAHRLELTVADAAGHETRATFQLMVNEAAVRRPWQSLFDQALFFNGREQPSGDRRFALVGHAESFFAPFAPSIVPVSAATDGALACYAVTPPDLPARQEFGVRFAVAPNAPDREKLGVVLAGRRPVFLGARYDAATDTVSGESTEFGTFCLIRDHRPPRIEAVRERPGKRFLSFRVTDEQTGIATDGVQVWIEDRRATVDFSPRSGRAEASVWWKIRGERTATIVAVDRLGNVARETLAVRFP